MLQEHAILSVELAPEVQGVHEAWPAKGWIDAPVQAEQPAVRLTAPSPPSPFVPGGHFRQVRSVAAEYSPLTHVWQPFPGQPTLIPVSASLSGSISRSSTVDFYDSPEGGRENKRETK